MHHIHQNVNIWQYGIIYMEKRIYLTCQRFNWAIDTWTLRTRVEIVYDDTTNSLLEYRAEVTLNKVQLYDHDVNFRGYMLYTERRVKCHIEEVKYM